MLINLNYHFFLMHIIFLSVKYIIWRILADSSDLLKKAKLKSAKSLLWAYCTSLSLRYNWNRIFFHSCFQMINLQPTYGVIYHWYLKKTSDFKSQLQVRNVVRFCGDNKQMYLIYRHQPTTWNKNELKHNVINRIKKIAHKIWR